MMDMQTQNGPTMVALPLHILQEIAGFRVPLPPAGAPLGMEENKEQAAKQAAQQQTPMPVRDSGGPVAAGQPFLSGRDDETEVTDSGKSVPVDPGVNVPTESGTVVTPEEKAAAAAPVQPSLFEPPTPRSTNPSPYRMLQDFSATAARAGLPQSALLSSFQQRTDPSQSPETDTSKQDPLQAGAANAGVAPPQFEHSAFDRFKSGLSAIEPGGEFDPANAPKMNQVHGVRRVLADIAGIGMGVLTGNVNAGRGIHDLIEDPGYRQRLSDWEQRRQAAVAGIQPLQQAADIERLRNNELQVGYNNAQTQAAHAANLAEQQHHHRQIENEYQDRIAAIRFAAANTPTAIARQAVDAEMARRGQTAQSNPELYLSLYDQAIKQVKPPAPPHPAAGPAATTDRQYLSEAAQLEANRTAAYQNIAKEVNRRWPELATGRDKFGQIIDPASLTQMRQQAAQYEQQQRQQIDADFATRRQQLDQLYHHAPAPAHAPASNQQPNAHPNPQPQHHQPPSNNHPKSIPMDAVKQYAGLAGITPAQATQIYIGRGYTITK